MMRRAIVIALLFLLGCGGGGPGMYAPGKSAQPTPEGASAAPSTKKFDFATEMKKEASDLRPFTVAAPDGSFTATVSAKSAPKISVPDDRHFAVVFDIGSSRAIDCAVFKKRVDPASTVWNLGVAPIESLQKQVLGIDVGADDDRPYLTLNIAAINDKKAAIVLKATVVALPESAVLCRHEDVGYVASAKAATLELARSLKWNRPAREARFHDLTVARVGGVTLGWNERFLYDGKDGVSFAMEYGALLLTKGDEGEVVAEDDVTVDEIDRDGLITSITKGEGTPKGLVTNVVLRRKSGVEYELDGMSEGEKVHATVKSKRPLRGMSLLAEDVLANARAAKPGVLFQETFSASDTTKTVRTATYTRAPSSTPAAPVYSVKSEDDDYVIAFDAQGSPVKSSGKIKGIAFEGARVFAKGDPRRNKK
jgi:hypothetical protein